MNCMYPNQECKSGCESGWTLYLDHSSISPYNQENEYKKNEIISRRLDDDEDLSMVSDASSGPPHLHEEEEGYGGGSNNNYPIIDDPLCKKGKTKKDKKRRRNGQFHQQSSLLDDTASSPFFDSSDKSFNLTRGQPLVGNNELEYSQGYSSTQFEMRPPYQDQYDSFRSIEPGNQLQQNQWFEGKRYEKIGFLEGQKGKLKNL